LVVVNLTFRGDSVHRDQYGQAGIEVLNHQSPRQGGWRGNVGQADDRPTWPAWLSLRDEFCLQSCAQLDATIDWRPDPTWRRIIVSERTTPPTGAPHEASGNPPVPSGAPAVVLGRLEKAIAVVLIALFVVFIVVLIILRASPHWDRLIFLFGGLEALVFAAAGALFGTGVQRAQTMQAQQVANQERQRADANESAAVHGQAVAAMVRAKTDNPGGGEGQEGRGARPTPGGGPADGSLADLRQVVDEWFPRTR
jgi:hypothetical protein